MRDPGERFHLVEIQTLIATEDDYGGQNKTWHTTASAYAKIEHGTGQERREAAQENANQSATFVFDYSPTLAAVKPSNRLYWLETVWDIASIAIYGANEEVAITTVANLEAAVDS